MSPIDPVIVPMTTDERTEDRIRALDRRIAQLERAPVVQYGSPNPTGAPRDGTLYAQPADVVPDPRLWVRIAGIWRYVELFTP